MFRKFLLTAATAAAVCSAGVANATVLVMTFTSGTTVLDTFKFDNATGVNNLVPGYLFFNIFDSANGYNAMYVGDASRSGDVGVGFQNGSLPNVNPTIFSAAFNPAFWSGTGFAVTFAPGQTYTASNGTVLSVSGIPEPASWALLLAGFGLTGAVMRRRVARVAA